MGGSWTGQRQAPANGFREMGGCKDRGVIQIGAGARHAQQPGYRTRAQCMQPDCPLKEVTSLGAQGAMLIDERIGQLGVGLTLTLQGPSAGPAYAIADRMTGFGHAGARKAGRINGLHGDDQIDPIQQGPGEPLAIAPNLIWGASAGLGRMSHPATGAGIHGGHELEGGWVVGCSGGPR